MMAGLGTVVFWVFGVAAIVSALCCILQANPVASALWLVSTMFSLAAIYVLLAAPFVAAVQVLVYAGAVMVLFLFVIMLLNLGRDPLESRAAPTMAVTIALVGLLAAELAALWSYTPARIGRELAGGLPSGTDAFPQAAAPGTLGANVVADVAAPLFREYLVPFEVTSMLLLAAIVGAVVLAKRRI